MRRRVIKLIILTLILVQTLSFTTVIIAKSSDPNIDTSLIIQRLRNLQSEVSKLPTSAFQNAMSADEGRKSLENKLQAVTHQIEAGAINGSLNKLKNDVKNAISSWLQPAWAETLIKLIDEIISLIKGIKWSTSDFKITALPSSLVIAQNSSAKSTIVVQSIKSFNQTVNLKITSTPINGLNITLSKLQVNPPSNGSANATLSINVSLKAPAGNYIITVTGTSRTRRHAVNVSLKITQIIARTPDFTISASPDSLAIQQGGTNISVITVTSLKGFSQPVDLNITSAHITGVSATVKPSPIIPLPNQSAVSILTIHVDGITTVGNYEVTVTGTNGSLQHSVSVNLTIATTPPPPPPKDTTPPTIVSAQRQPSTPAYNQNVTVVAFVYDLGSGIKEVILNYTWGAAWTPVNMTLSQGLYTCSIPAFAYNTTVEYRIFATDKANNLATSILFSYTVIDPYPPLLRIDSPAQGSYVAGTVPITVFMKDQNTGGESGFGGAELSINSAVVKTWMPPAPSDPTTYNWNTSAFGPDGTYTIRLIVRDRAGNVVSKSVTVIVDNTLPTADIISPAEGSYLRLMVLIKVTGDDTNFDKMEVRIDDKLVKTFLESGNETLEWDTPNYADDAHTVALTVFDKAGNQKQVVVTATVDNTPPLIGPSSWWPKEPATNVDIKINVSVTEPTHGSGVANVTLWYKNKTVEDWLAIPMVLRGSNWTVTLSNQSDTKVRFFIEAFDHAGNRAATEVSEFTVAAPAGFPLIWLLLIVIVLAILIGAAAYVATRRTGKKEEGAGGAPPSVSRAVPLPSPPLLPIAPTVSPPPPAAAGGYAMVSFVVPVHNEETVISQHIARAFGRAAGRVGPSEIIVVDDGSVDNTFEAAWMAVESNRTKWPNIPVKVVKLSSNMGREEAVRVGRSKATGEIVETVDGENTSAMPVFMGHLILSL
jgi:hypothetical protein